LLRLCLCWCATPICFVFSPAIVFSLLRTKKPRVPDEPTALQTTRQKKDLYFSLVSFLSFSISIFIFFRVKIESKNINKEFPTAVSTSRVR
jgi:hypothetical protein